MKKVLLLLICLVASSASLSPASSAQSNDGFVLKLNKAIDFTLGVARWVFTKHGELSLPLPAIGREFGHDVYKGWFNASGGSFRNIGSLHRTGDIAFSKAGSTLSIQVALGLSELQAGYSNYTLNILTIKQTGQMNLSVTENSLKMKMSFTYSPACQLDIEEIAFDQLSGIKVDITGLGAFQLFYNELSSWLVSNFEERFRTIANRKMHQKLRDAIKKRSDLICKWWPHFG